MTKYEMLSLVIDGAVAVATFLAVCVALWQTKYQNRKKLKLDFSPYVFTTSQGLENNYYVALNIVNVGRTKITISNWQIYFKEGIRMQMFTEGFGDYVLNSPLYIHLPHVLESDEGVSLYAMQEPFFNKLHELLEKNYVHEDDKLLMVVHDVAGNEYKLKTKFTVKELSNK